MSGTQGSRSVRSTLEELNLSEKELKKFERAFDDPEFIRMFSDYASEMQDPANRAETEEYLRQLEGQGEIENMYGRGTILIVPTPEFAVKTKAQPCGTKVFLNLCSCMKVDKPTFEAAADGEGKPGRRWKLPLTGSNCKRDGIDKKGARVWVWDVTMHKEAFTLTANNRALLTVMVESAIEHVEKTNDVKLDKNFTCPRLRFKSTPGYKGAPPATALRGSGTYVTSNGMLRPCNTEDDTSTCVNFPIQGKVPKREDSSSFVLPVKSKIPASPKSLKPSEPGFKHPNGEETPRYRIIHQGIQDLGDAWSDTTVHSQHNIPHAIIVRAELPKVKSAADIIIEPSATKFCMKVATMYLLEIELPFTVDETQASAKFDIDTGYISVQFPVDHSYYSQVKKSSSCPPPLCNESEDTNVEQNQAHVDGCWDESEMADSCSKPLDNKPGKVQEAGLSSAQTLCPTTLSTRRGAMDDPGVKFDEKLQDFLNVSKASGSCTHIDNGTTIDKSWESSSAVPSGTDNSQGVGVVEHSIQATYANESIVGNPETCYVDPNGLRMAASQWQVVHQAHDQLSLISCKETCKVEAGSKSCCNRVEVCEELDTKSIAKGPGEHEVVLSKTQDDVLKLDIPDFNLDVAVDLPMLNELD